MKEKDVLLSSTRAKLESLQADHCASDDTVSGLEELLADKDKQIERSATCFCLMFVALLSGLTVSKPYVFTSIFGSLLSQRKKWVTYVDPVISRHVRQFPVSRQ